MEQLQYEIERLNTGTLLAVKLLNYPEISLLVEKADLFMEKFYLIVETVCMEISMCTVVKAADPTKIYILLPNDEAVIERLAYSIYLQVHLYVDTEFPYSYLKCTIGSIKFDHKKEFNLIRLLSNLNYGMTSLNDSGFYYRYEQNPVNLEKLKTNNLHLNFLRNSILKSKIKFAYQPIIDRETGGIEYYECLLRIQDDKDNFVSIGPIVADAESKGLINIVDFMVVEMAVKELSRDKNIKLSVNISNIGLLNKSLQKKIENLFQQYDVADRLIIEITETSLNQNFEDTKIFINALHSYGCCFALDDFGSGFTSFKQLLHLPIDIIKIDGSYIRGILIDKYSRSFVKSFINLAANLGIKTVAEFVENGEIAKYLIDIKIDGMQGNFFLPASETRL